MSTAFLKPFPSGHWLRNWSLTAGNNPFWRDYCYYWHSVVYGNILLKTLWATVQLDLVLERERNQPLPWWLMAAFYSNLNVPRPSRPAEFIIYYISCCSKKYALHQSQHSNQWSKNITFIVSKIESCCKGWMNAWLKLDVRNHFTCHERFLADTQPYAVHSQWLIVSWSRHIHIAKRRIITKVMLLISHNFMWTYVPSEGPALHG